MSVSEMCQGQCKWFDSKKGYGFISTDDGLDLFVHQSEIRSGGFRNLAEGEKVEFMIATLEDGRKKAVNVTGPAGSPVEGERRRRGGGVGSPGRGGGGMGRGMDMDMMGRGGGMVGRGGSNGGGRGGRGGQGEWRGRSGRDFENWREE